MEPSLFQWLKDDITSIKTEMALIRGDVNTLLEWKWKIAGASFLASIVLTVLFQIALAYIKQ